MRRSKELSVLLMMLKLSNDALWLVCLMWSYTDDGLGEASFEPFLPIPKCSLQLTLRFIDVFQ